MSALKHEGMYIVRDRHTSDKHVAQYVRYLRSGKMVERWLLPGSEREYDLGSFDVIRKVRL